MKQSLRDKAFSLIELIFVLLLLVIISSFVIPKFNSTNEKTKLFECKNDYNIIKSNLNIYKNKNILKSKNNIFDINSYLNSNWKKESSSKYYFIIDEKTKIEFTLDLNNYTFTCVQSNTLCIKVIN